jgi:hypothetical protein
VAAFLDHAPPDLAVVAQAVPGVVAVFSKAIANGHDVDLQVKLEGRHYVIFVNVHDHEAIVEDVTVTIDARSLDERTRLVLLHLHTGAVLQRQAKWDRQQAARMAAIRARVAYSIENTQPGSTP